MPAVGALSATPAALAGSVAERRAAIRSLRATGKLQVTVDARRGGEIRRNRFKSSQAILVRSPAAFRLEALSPFGVSYAVASDGRDLAVLIPGESVVYRGAANIDTVAAATGVAASPEDAAELLLGLPPVPPLDLGSAWLSRPADNAVAPSAEGDFVAPEILLHATAEEPPEAIVVVGFARLSPDDATLVAVLFERITDAGDLVLRARFGAFRTTPAGPIATRVELQADDSEAVLRYMDLEVNPPLEDARFAVTTPAGARELPLDLPAGAASDDPA